MPRKIVLKMATGNPVLSEVPAADEFELQELMKGDPDLIPIEEFGMTGPLLVIGRETTLPSGAVDLVALARSGEILIIEFKTGPQNPDFRHAIAQLIDYGSDIWTLSFDDFESTVPLRYFSGKYCSEARIKGASSLIAAAKVFWTDLTENDEAALRDAVTQQLRSGAFSYVLVAQRFTASTEKTIAYLNAISPARFFAVELVRFDGDGVSAFESRTIFKPTTRTSTGTTQQNPSYANEDAFLEQIQDPEYRDCVHRLFEVFTGLGLQLAWGTVGVSIRMPTSDMAEPLTIAWLFPPGRTGGWMGLTELTLGFDPSSLERRPLAKDAVRAYSESVHKLPGATVVKSPYFQGSSVTLQPEFVLKSQNEISELVADLVTRVNSG